MAPHSSTLAWKIPWMEEPGRLQSMGSQRVGHDWVTSFSLFTFHFHALEKEMATHSSVLAWRIPGTGEPGGLPSMGSHRVGHVWIDLEAATSYGIPIFGHLDCPSFMKSLCKAVSVFNGLFPNYYHRTLYALTIWLHIPYCIRIPLDDSLHFSLIISLLALVILKTSFFWNFLIKSN